MSELKPINGGRASSSIQSSVREAQDDPHRLAQIYMRIRGLSKGGWALRFWRDEWWIWNGRYYRHLHISELSADVTNVIKAEFDRFAGDDKKKCTDDGKPFVVAKVTRSVVGNVLQALKGRCLVSSELEQPCWLDPSRTSGRIVAVENGLVDLDRALSDPEHALLPHSPEWFSPVCCPYPFLPEAECSRFLAFVEEMFERDAERIALLQEWFGYFLNGDTSLQKFLILLGEGANGKTVLLSILTALLGESNVTHVPLELFGERFLLTPTLGKLANIVPEIGDIDRVAEGFLKAYVAGDRMHFDRKNLPGIDARPTARLVLATNNLPPFADRSEGVFRRLIILPCRVVIAPDRQDRHLTETLLKELPGIFNWGVLGYGRLRKNGLFTEPAVCRRLLEECRIDNNPARAFLLNEIRLCPGKNIPCSVLYQMFREWCEPEGFRACNERQFGKEVFRVYPNVRRVRARGTRQEARPWIYVGLAVTDSGDVDQSAPASPGVSTGEFPRAPVS